MSTDPQKIPQYQAGAVPRLDRAALTTAALSYLAAGLNVIPVNARKTPALESWKSYQKEMVTPEQVRNWARSFSVAGFAIICGKISGGLTILDFDEPDFYKKWKGQVGEPANILPTQQTGSGGYHVAFRSKLQIRNDKLAYVPADNPEGREAAIETRGEGGYAVIAPSFCHLAEKHGEPHQKPYTVIQGDFAAIPIISKEEAQRLLEAARSLSQVPLSKKQMQAAPLPPRSNENGSGVIGAFNERYELLAILERNGYESRGNRYLAPGSTTGLPGVHIFENGRCYSHHGNDSLNDGHAHDAFSVYCILEHGGDAKAAVKAAAEALGIERTPRQTRLVEPQGVQADPFSTSPRLAPEAPKNSPPSITPPWPDEVMTGAAGKFARTYGAYLETPESFLFMAHMTFLGHVISDRISLDSEIAAPPRLFTIILGESGDTRKSTSISKPNAFYQEVINPDDFNSVWGVGSAEGLAKCFKKNKRAILILDELKSLIQKMRIDASVLLPCINTLFESKRFHSFTKKHDIIIDDAELCLLAASTLETYRNMFNSTFMDIGFLNRLFIVIGDSKKMFSIPDKVPQAEKEVLKADLQEVLSFVGELSLDGCYSMPINSTARDIFDAWYFGLEPSSFTRRLDTYGHRLMPLLAINEKSNIVTPDIAEMTVKLLNYQLAARKFADPIDADSAIARLEERIRRLLSAGPLPKRDLERRGNKNRVGIWAWDQAIKNLQRDGAISWDHKTREFRIND